MTLACSAAAQKDAAEKVQEGNVNNWIEYYKKQREAAQGDAGAEQKRRDKANLEEEQGELSPNRASNPGQRPK